MAFSLHYFASFKDGSTAQWVFDENDPIIAKDIAAVLLKAKRKTS